MSRKEYHRQYYEDHKEEKKAYGDQYNQTHIEEKKAYNHQYHKDHKDEINRKKRQYTVDNKDEINRKKRQYRKDNKEKTREQGRQYRKKHKEHLRQYRKKNPQMKRRYYQKRRAKKKNLPATLTEEEWQKILDDHFHRCHYCGKKSDSLHQEHKIPISKKGGYTKENIVPSCISCNSQKHNKNYKKFIKNTNNRLQMKLFED